LRPKGEQPSDRIPPDDPANPSVNFHGERRGNATHQSTCGYSKPGPARA
jgi:hypothetical protein